MLTAWRAITPTRRASRIDWLGAALVAVGMGLSVLGFEQAATWGWGSPRTWLCIVGGLLVLVVFVRFELRAPQPADPGARSSATGRSSSTTLVLFLSMIAFVPVFFFASVYSQVSLGYDANKAGLYLLLFFAGFAPAAQIGGRMLDRAGRDARWSSAARWRTVGFALWAS